MALNTLSTPHVLLGPTFPTPRLLSTNFGFFSTCSQLSSTLKGSLEQGRSPFGDFAPNASSVSISMTSTAQESTIFDFNFQGASLSTSAGGTDRVSVDSIFRIGSISKLLTVYAFLLNGGLELWERPVTEYVPELRQFSQSSSHCSDLNTVRWEEVTLGSLASQMSGIGRDYENEDLSIFPFPWTEQGLPQLTSANISTCGRREMQRPCTREEYFQGFVNHHPVFLPYSTPIYSNTAFRILSYALETIGGTSFEDIMERQVCKPLGFIHTSIRKPANKLGVIPSGDSGWFYDIGDEAPGGGMYSTSSDLARFGRDILLSAHLSPSVTRRWMKPLAHTSALTASVGAPWEIWRTRSNITTGNTIDLYTKDGSIGQYNSLLVLIPDYQVAVSILTAGPDGSVINAIAETVVQTIIPILHQSAREEATKKLAGHYVSDGSVNSSMQLKVEESDLVITKWISEGSDLLATADAYSHMTNGGNIRSVMLYPTDLVDETDGRIRIGYRALFEAASSMTSVTRVFTQDNMWGRVDQNTYGGISVDEFILELDIGGNAISIEPCVLGIRLMRIPL